jgi:hypothetical protein
MNETLKKISAGLLTLAVIGGVSGLLTMSLAAGVQPVPATEVDAAQTANETVVVYGTKPANYAGLVAHRKHKGAAGTPYAALRHEGLGMLASK